MNTNDKLTALIHYLDPQRPIPTATEDKRLLLRALMNIRAPQCESADFWRLQDEVLQQQQQAKGVLTLADLPQLAPNIYLWQGDITRLQVDAIVNAANSQMLGCFQPLHRCIDNAIHSQAGLQLRLTCARHMQQQGHAEPTGHAHITPGYNLPARHVIHTVGPIVQDELTALHRQQLTDCYRACLALALENGLNSIAFCCISTGEFRFPNQPAAEIAVATVRAFLADQPQLKVVFNVFKDVDLHIYQRLLAQG